MFIIFGRTDLRKGVSRAKFDAESDFEVHLAVAPQKPCHNSEKTIFGQNFEQRLPLKDGSVRPQTLGKRVSDDSRHFIFRRRKTKMRSCWIEK